MENDEKEKSYLALILITTWSITWTCVVFCCFAFDAVWNEGRLKPLQKFIVKVPIALCMRKKTTKIYCRTKYAQGNSLHSSDSYIMYLFEYFDLEIQLLFQGVQLWVDLLYRSFMFDLNTNAPSLQIRSETVYHIFFSTGLHPVPFLFRIFNSLFNILKYVINVYLFSAYFCHFNRNTAKIFVSFFSFLR